MELTQDHLDSLHARIGSGELTVSQANVESVRLQRVLLVLARIPADVRRDLRAAVKSGILGHVAKDGRKPEAFFHPSFSYLVPSVRNRHAESIARAIAATCAPSSHSEFDLIELID